MASKPGSANFDVVTGLVVASTIDHQRTEADYKSALPTLNRLFTDYKQVAFDHGLKEYPSIGILGTMDCQHRRHPL